VLDFHQLPNFFTRAQRAAKTGGAVRFLLLNRAQRAAKTGGAVRFLLRQRAVGNSIQISIDIRAGRVRYRTGTRASTERLLLVIR